MQDFFFKKTTTFCCYFCLDLYQVKRFLEQDEFQKKSQIFGLRLRPCTIFSQHIVHALKNWENKYVNHSMARVNLNKSKKSLEFYYHSITVHSQEAQNLHQLKSSLSDSNLLSKSTSKFEHCETRFTYLIKNSF